MEKIDNKKIMRRYIDEVENSGDVTNIREFIDENYVEIYEGKPFGIGVKGAIDHVLGVRRVFPDLKLTIENMISEDDYVVTIYSVTGTFKGEWFDMKPTGKKITFTGVNVDRFKNEKIIEHGGAANLLDPLLNAGVIIKKK